MMHQSEVTLQPHKYVPEYLENQADAIYRNPKLPGWQESSENLYDGKCIIIIVIII